MEFALMVPLMCASFFLIFEVGRVFGSWLLVTNAAREGARYGVTQSWSAGDSCPGSCTATDTTIQSRVTGAGTFLVVQGTCQANNQPPSGATSCIAITRSTATDGSGDHLITVLAVYQVQTLFPITANNIPFLGAIHYPGSVTVFGQSTMRSEQ